MIAANFGGKLELFQQEYPLTPDEAFITSGNTVFDTKKIADIQWALKSTATDGGPVQYPEKTFRYSHQEDGFYAAPYGPLRVYASPVENGLYVMGGDVSEGIDKTADESTLQVLKLPEMIQVATFQHRVRPDDLADIAAALGRLYNWALVAVENNGPGVATNLRLSQVLYYPNLYRREIFDGEERKFTSKIGWQTNRASKPVMITALREALDEDLLLFRDVDTLDQMLTYVQHKDGTLGAVQGKNDDLVISLAVGLQAAFQHGVVGTDTKTMARSEGTMGWYMERAAREEESEVIGYRDYGEMRI